MNATQYKGTRIQTTTDQAGPEGTNILDGHETDDTRNGEHPKNREGPVRIFSWWFVAIAGSIPNTQVDYPVFDELPQRCQYRKAICHDC